MKVKTLIAIIDDDLSVRKALSRLLHAAGYDANTHESAEEFLGSSGAPQSDCLILDVHLPGISGLELWAEIRHSIPSIQVVFISAFSDDNARAQAIQTGAIDFLPKPVDSDRLLESIERALARFQD